VNEGEWTVEELARRFHEIYERRAPEFGYETRKETRTFDPTTPNGRLMIAVCTEIADAHNAELDAERKHSAYCTKMANERLEQTVQLRAQLAAAKDEVRVMTNHSVQLRHELAAAQAKWEDALEANRQTERLLSAAQAAIAEAHAEGYRECRKLYPHDKEAIAAAQQPLVQKITELEGRLSKYEQS
jgi:hypothetical protein